MFGNKTIYQHPRQWKNNYNPRQHASLGQHWPPVGQRYKHWLNVDPVKRPFPKYSTKMCGFGIKQPNPLTSHNPCFVLACNRKKIRWTRLDFWCCLLLYLVLECIFLCLSTATKVGWGAYSFTLRLYVCMCVCLLHNFANI